MSKRVIQVLIFFIGMSAGWIGVQKPQPPWTSIKILARIQNDNEQYRYPKFSPDGTKVAFFSDDGLMAAAIADRQPKSLIRPGGMSYAWSPDGTRIAVVSDRLRIAELDSGQVQSYPVGQFNSPIHFDLDGHVCYVASTNLVGVQFDGDLAGLKQRSRLHPKLVVITEDQVNYVENAPAQAKEWVHGNVIVPYVLLPTGDVYLNMNGQDQKITPEARFASSVKCLWAGLSPDRSKVDIICTGNNFFVHDIQESATYRIGKGLQSWFNAWSSDSEWIMFVSSRGDGHTIKAADIYVSHYTGGSSAKVAHVPNAINGISWSRGNMVAYSVKGTIVIGQLQE